MLFRTFVIWNIGLQLLSFVISFFYCIDIIERNLEIEILTLKLRHFEPGVKMKNENETLPDFYFSPIIEIILQLLCYTFAIYYWNSES